MNLSKPEILEKLHTEKFLIGFDLGKDYSQVSYCFQNSENPETASYTAGGEQYSIPTVLCKRKEVGQWFFGREAVSVAEQNEGILVEDLLTKAYDGEEIVVEGVSYDPVSMLTLFVKRSMSILTFLGGVERIGAFMITTQNLDERMVEVLGRVVSGIGLKTNKIFFQNHMESFYSYMLYQPKELWLQHVLLCDYSSEEMHVFAMERNLHSTPIVIYIDEKSSGEVNRKESREGQDMSFAQVLNTCCSEAIVSSIFLIGDGFGEDWMQESLKIACAGRRVFRGNNLYSKGACYSLRERMQENTIGKDYVFLGKDKLRANIGMQVLKRGVEMYQPLLDAGNNWYDCKKEIEFIPEKENRFELVVTPLNGKGGKIVEVSLDNLPRRPAKTTRLHLSISLKDAETVVLDIEDKGFGEIFPSSGLSWTETFEI